MKKKRYEELLNKLIAYIVGKFGYRDAIKQLYEAGFSLYELINIFSFDLECVQSVVREI